MLKGALIYLPNKLKADHIKENTKDDKRLESRAPNERVESSHEAKTLNFKVIFIKLEYN